MELDIVAVKEILRAYGYDVKDSDDKLLRIALDRAIKRVKAFCNRKDIPEPLYTEVAHMAVGEFFYMIKPLVGLDGLGFYNPNPGRISQMTEGDTSFSISNSSLEETSVNDFIKKLRYGDPYVLEHYRFLDWWTR